MADNWYIVLELEFSPNPVEDQAVIEQRIQEKSKFWSSNFNHSIHGPEYRRYHQMIQEIKRAMSDETERKRLIQEACDIVYGPIDKKIKIVGRGKGSLTESEAENIAIQQKVAVDVVKRRITELGFKLILANPQDDYQKLYDQYYKNKPQSAAKFDGMKQLLSSFGVDNLYDFLYANTSMKNTNKLPPDTLRQRAQERKKNEFNKHDAISGNGSKLCGHCELTFKDDPSKAEYDEYLEHCKRKSILDQTKDIVNISGELSAEQADMFIGLLTELFKDREKSTKVLVAFCKIEKLAYHARQQSDPSVKIKVCRCGCTNDVSDGRQKCRACGMDLTIKCPKCGLENDALNRVCSCGFDLDKIDKAMALCDLAEGAIDIMDFNTAQICLTDAERFLPGDSRIKFLTERLTENKQRIGSVAASMRQAATEKRYVEAKKQYANIQKLFPSFREAELEEEMEKAISDAETLYKSAQASKDEKEVVDKCSKAYEVCRDYPGIKELISKYPPQMPANLRVSIDGNSRTNFLSWDPSSSDGAIFYTIVRKKDAIPVNVDDGETVARVSMGSCNDNKLFPGICYYYAVFAERAGIFSKGLVSKDPVINLFEVSNATVSAGDSILQMTWDHLPKGAMLEIYRSTGSGKEERVNSTNPSGYLDSELVNDQVYNYRLCLAYNVNGQKQVTKGIRISGMPVKPPRAIETLRISRIQDDTFQAVWDNPDNQMVQFYCSNARPEYMPGDMMAQSALESKMRRFAVNKTGNNAGTFQYKEDETLYVVPVVIKSGSAVIGNIARVSKGEELTVKNIAAVNDKIHIYINVPKKATGFVVLYRFDQFPQDISDVKTVRKYIPLKQYQYNDALIVDTLEQKNYYFSVFAEFTHDGEKDYSSGANYLFTNQSKQVITYSINVSKKIFGDSSVVLEFESENRAFFLPAIEILSAIGNTPMFKATGNPFYKIPAQQVNGSLQVRIPMPRGMEKETHIKAFLQDDTMGSSYQLKLKVKSSYKIN